MKTPQQNSKQTNEASSIPAVQMELIRKHAQGLGIPVEKVIKQMPNVNRLIKSDEAKFAKLLNADEG